MSEFIVGTDGHEGHWLTGEKIVRCRDCKRFSLDKTERIEWIAGRLRGETNENDRLRELVRDMYAAFVHGNCYRWCEFKEPCNYIDDGRCQWYDRMRELGVEVEL